MIQQPPQPDASPREDIALVGMACMVPGADSPERLWQNIVHKVDCVTDALADWNPDFYYDPAGSEVDRTYTKKGGFLGDLCRFSPSKYGVPPTNIDGAEPDQFIALRCACEALNDAGFPDVPLNRSKTSVIIGRGIFVNRGWATVFQRAIAVENIIQLLQQIEPDRSADDLEFLRAELKKVLPPCNADTFPGLVHNALAGRIANRFDFMGPSYTVDAACASTLIAVEHGIRELRAGRCDAVLAGGSQVSTPGPVHTMFCHLQALSRSGRIAPFSTEANGTLLGQGCGIVVLKRRTDAERDGNRIYALIKAVGVASDGKGVGLLAPRTEGQQLAISRAYQEAGVTPQSIGLVEAHGTGIPLGDATEIGSLRAVFGDRPDGDATIALGSVKSMLGHLLPASGVPSLIKTALALHHRVLPPTLHAEQANDNLGLNDSRFFLSTEARPWLHEGPDTNRRAGINSFGFGGINAHAVLEEYPGDESRRENYEREWPSELVVLYANSREALAARAIALTEWLAKAEEPRLLDIAASCAAESGSSRLAIVAQNVPDLIKKLGRAARLLEQPERTRIQDRSGIFWQAEPLARSGRVAHMFPGEGCQYTNMLSDLCRHFPEVRQEFDLTARALAQRGKSLSRILFPQPAATSEADGELLQMEFAVAAVTAASRGLWRLLVRLGVKAAAMVGHSSGEYASLLASGACGDPNSDRLVRVVIDGVDSASELQRSELVPQAVLMSAGGVPQDVLEEAIAASKGKVVIAMDNCPNQRVLVGAEEAIAEVLARLHGKGGICQRLEWNRAYHTTAFRPASAIVKKYINTLELNRPQVELWSCATANRFPAESEQVRELAVEQWSSPVRFRETILAMYDAGVRVFVEVGPRGNLSAFVSDTLAGKPHAVVPLNVSNVNDLTQLCVACGMLAASGVDLAVNELFVGRSPRVLDFSTPPLPARKRERYLRTDLPMFSFDEHVIGQLQKPKERALDDGLETSVSMRPIEPAHNTNGELKSTNGHARIPDRQIVAPAIRTNPSTRYEVVKEFQATMQQFLRTQETVAAAYARRNRAAEADAIGTSSFTSSQSPPSVVLARPADVARKGSTKANNHSSDVLDNDARSVIDSVSPRKSPAKLQPVALVENTPRKLPFIETILEFKPGERLISEFELTIDKHPFLADHTFFGRWVSNVDSNLRALPVMPMVMTLELMAEGAVTLFPNSTVSVVRDIRATGWLTCPGQSRRIRIEAKAENECLVHVGVFAADVDGGEEIAAGSVELAPRSKTLGPAVLPQLAQSPPPWAPEDVYDHFLYHGPSFQGIIEFEDFGPRGLTCRAQRTTVRLLRDFPNESLILPVALIDIASQVPGLVNANYKAVGKWTVIAFPNTIGRLEISDAAWGDGPLTINSHLDQSSGKLISDTEILLPNGEAIVRYLNRAEELVEFPLPLYLYAGPRSSIPLATPLHSTFQGVPGIEYCQVCEVTGAGDRLLIKNHWAQVVGNMILSAAERSERDRHKFSPVALSQWLLSRVAAKEATRQFAGVAPRLADVPIDQDTSGRQRSLLPNQELFYVSVGQQLFFTVGVAAPAERFAGIGLSAESLRPLESAQRDTIFNSAELVLLRAAAAENNESEDTWLRFGRAAKEAFLKANNSTSSAELSKIDIGSIDAGKRCVTVQPATAFLAHGGSFSVQEPANAADVYCRIHEQHVLALCLIPRETSH